MSYRVLALAVCLALLVINVSSLVGAESAVRVTRQTSMMMLAFIGILPTLVLAWNEPDLPAEDA